MGHSEAQEAPRRRSAPWWLKKLRALICPAPEEVVTERVAQEVAQAFFFALDQEAFIRVVRAILIREVLDAYGNGEAPNQKPAPGNPGGSDWGGPAPRPIVAAGADAPGNGSQGTGKGAPAFKRRER